MNLTFYTENKITESSIASLSLTHYSTGAGLLADTDYDLSRLMDRTSTVQLSWSIPAAYSYSDIKYTFSSAAMISAMQLKNINFKNFQILVSNTTIILSPSWGGTVVSSWNNFSDSNVIVEFATVTANSVTLRVYSSTSGDPAIGEWIVGEKILRLARNPNASGYDPNITNQKLEVKTVDGGSVVYNQTSKFQAKIKLEWFDQSATMVDLQSLYNLTAPFYFTPYPTISAWYGESYECNWVGNFDFLQNKYNYRGTPYYAGTMQLKETPL